MKLTPTSKLLKTVAAVLFPLAAAATAWPWAIPLWVAAATLFFLAAGADAVRSRGLLAGIRLEAPALLRLSKGRMADLPLHIHNPMLRVERLRIGLDLPERMQADSVDRIVTLPPEAPRSRITWPVRATRQGRYTMDRCFIAVLSPWGFWSQREEVVLQCEIRCYPDLSAERQLFALFMRRQAGSHPQRQIGKGRDYDQLREYCYGDSYEDIHWKATARRGYPVTKMYQVEQMQKIYVIVDTSRLSARRPASSRGKNSGETDGGGETIFERYMTAALIMGMAAERGGDLFGLVAFADRPGGFIRAGSGKAHYNACRDMLYTLETRNVAPDFAELFTFIGTRIRKRAMLIFLTSLDDPVLAESFIRDVRMVSRRHLATVVMVDPVGAEPVFSSPHVHCLDDLYRALGGHLVWDNLHQTGRLLRRQGADFALVSSRDLCAHLTSQYFGAKQRQAI